MTRPLRLMILHLSHIFLTDGLTFILPPPKRFDNVSRLLFVVHKFLFKTIGDSSAREVVGRQLDCDFVAGQDSDEVHADFPRHVRQNFVAVWQLDLEHRVGQSLQNFAFDFDNVLL